MPINILKRPFTGGEKRAQFSRVDTSGGFLVHREQAVRFWAEVLDDELLRLVSSYVIPYDSQPRFIRDNSANVAQWVAENAVISSVDDAFVSDGPTTLHKLVAASTASIEFMQDVQTMNVETFESPDSGMSGADMVLDTLHAKRVARAMNNAILNGLGGGSNQPLGILNDVAIPDLSLALSTASLRQLYTTLDADYAKRAVWLVNPKYWPEVRSTAGGGGDLSTELDQPYILDRPVILSRWMPASNSVVFGDFSSYGMLMSDAIAIRVDMQSDALSGGVRRFSYQRVDGAYIRGTEGESMAVLAVP